MLQPLFQLYSLVSIHALTRRATLPLLFISLLQYCFNPRPHAEGDHLVFDWTDHSTGFNPRPHAEGDRCCTALRPVCSSFNPRPHAEGDSIRRPIDWQPSKFQSTPSRGGRHCKGDWATGGQVSIHALTRRATYPQYQTSTSRVFQSTPSRGGRQNVQEFSKSVILFQSTPSRGGRQPFSVQIGE